MNVLITGASGFMGKNLAVNLKNIRDGKDSTKPDLRIDEIYEYDVANTVEDLKRFCMRADFVFNFAGVNRPKDPEEFWKGNFEFAKLLLNTLKGCGNKCPVMLSSSIQAALSGRFGKTEYGLSKRAAEDLYFRYGEDTGAEVMVYRFPNTAGKWERPNYNSVVATFCYNISHDLPIMINDVSTELEIVFIDDLITEMFEAMRGVPHRCNYSDMTPEFSSDGKYCYVPVIHRVRLGYIAECLKKFYAQRKSLVMPAIPPGSFESKLYSMYLSYLPKEKVIHDLKMNCDNRGSFTEILKTVEHGQFSVNISKPGITKGQHWHNNKWEIFVVVSGHGLIQERKIDSDEIIEFEVSGEKIQAIYMLPGYAHNIINLSESENLVTLMWANEIFNPDHIDTYHENV